MGSRPRNEVWADTMPGIRAVGARPSSPVEELNRFAIDADQGPVPALARVQVWTSAAWRFVVGRSNGKAAPKGPADRG